MEQRNRSNKLIVAKDIAFECNTQVQLKDVVKKWLGLLEACETMCAQAMRGNIICLLICYCANSD